MIFYQLFLRAKKELEYFLDSLCQIPEDEKKIQEARSCLHMDTLEFFAAAYADRHNRIVSVA